MGGSLFRVIFTLGALLLALISVIVIARSGAELGATPLLLRALLVNVPVIAAVLALTPWLPPLLRRPLAFVLTVLLPALLPAFLYYLLLLPQRAGEGLVAEQLDVDLITDRSSSGIVEVGFSYPIFTPRIVIENRGLFTRRVDVFFRLDAEAGNSALFRAVRARIPAAGLSVEATVQGMLRENEDYLFIPLSLPPGQTLEGRVVFIISSIEDGRSFTETFMAASSAQLELRNAETGVLELEIPILGSL